MNGPTKTVGPPLTPLPARKSRGVLENVLDYADAVIDGHWPNMQDAKWGYRLCSLRKFRRGWLQRCRQANAGTRESLMTRILLLGLDPETVDYSDPALPPGMTIEKVRAGIAVALKQFTDRGWESDVGYIRPDETAGPAVERQLRSTNYDCVVIGGGVRLPPRHLALFEVVIDAIRRAAPGAAIAFNTRPDDSADAAARWVTAKSQAL